MNTSIRFLFVFLLAGMPFFTFGMAAFFNLVKIDFFVIAAIIFLGFPFWLFFVLPITLLFKLKNSTPILYLILIIAILLTGVLTASQWTTNLYGITIGNKIFVEKGQAVFGIAEPVSRIDLRRH